jgi:5-methylcytosine-specific restriction endonuclease McrA
LILRDDFNSEEGAAAGEQGKSEASKTDLSKGENFYLTLRKPDFQRETAAWSPEGICNFLESFVGGDLIPAVICWQSASRLTFVIDGAHRLSAVIAWSAVAIDPTEFTILNSRNKANAISSRVIVRNGTEHKYWKDFSSNGQEQVVKRGKYIYSALYDPPLDPPIKTAELPIAGHGYGTQTLPLIFDFVNIANDIQVVDSSKKSKLLLTEQRPPDESATTQCLARAQGLADIFTGTHPSSLGLHPAVYFYSVSGRHQPTAMLAVAALFVDLRRENKFIDFSKVRGTFEEFLLDHKVYINQLTVKHGSMAKGFRPLRDYYRFVLDCLWSGKSHEDIEFALSSNEKYRRLVKEKPILSKKPKKMSKGVKQYVVIAEALAQASICQLCEARIDLKAMHVDHIKDRSKGGAGSGENARPLHPYCDSTYKRYLENAKATV